MTPAELTGRARTHVVSVPDPACTLHADAVAAFLKMRSAARTAGLELRAESSFRDFDRQTMIWNGKFLGLRPVYGPQGALIDVARLSAAERVEAILVWSALPGSSRHHWGTDVDLIDVNAVAGDYRVQLTVEEYLPTGPFGPLSNWLELHAARFGFFRPFRGVLSGVQAEPWHFSFAPVAEPARRALTPAVLAAALESATPLEGKQEILAKLDELHARYVSAIDWP